MKLHPNPLIRTSVEPPRQLLYVPRALTDFEINKQSKSCEIFMKKIGNTTFISQKWQKMKCHFCVISVTLDEFKLHNGINRPKRFHNSNQEVIHASPHSPLISLPLCNTQTHSHTHTPSYLLSLSFLWCYDAQHNNTQLNDS